MNGRTGTRRSDSWRCKPHAPERASGRRRRRRGPGSTSSTSGDRRREALISRNETECEGAGRVARGGASSPEQRGPAEWEEKRAGSETLPCRSLIYRRGARVQCHACRGANGRRARRLPASARYPHHRLAPDLRPLLECASARSSRTARSRRPSASWGSRGWGIRCGAKGCCQARSSFEIADGTTARGYSLSRWWCGRPRRTSSSCTGRSSIISHCWRSRARPMRRRCRPSGGDRQRRPFAPADLPFDVGVRAAVAQAAIKPHRIVALPALAEAAIPNHLDAVAVRKCLLQRRV